MNIKLKALFSILMITALVFGFIHVYFPSDNYSFERLHIFLFNLCTGGTILLYYTQGQVKVSKIVSFFFLGSLIYAFSAFFKIYSITILISIPLFVVVEKIRIEKFSLFPVLFFKFKEPVSEKFHQASLLCLSVGIVMAGLVILNNEYFKFIEYHKSYNNMEYEEFEPGSCSQIILKYDKEKYPDFSIRNLTCSGRIWTGEAKETFKVSGNLEENDLSTSFRLQYGSFKYFTGADISGVDGLSMPNINSIEAHVAPLVGPVDVATMNHHGNRNSLNPYFVRTIRPRVWISEVWSSDQPGDDALRRALSRLLYPNDRDLFSTAMLDVNEIVLGSIIDENYKSKNGHIVVRVYPGGDNYKIYVLNCFNESREVIKEFDYKSR